MELTFVLSFVLRYFAEAHGVLFMDLTSVLSFVLRYFAEAHGVLFVIDSADPGRFEEARAALDSIVGHPSLEGIPLLIMANKQDRADAREVDEMDEVLAVGAIQTSGRACRTQAVSALTCEGIEEGVVWLIEAVKKGGLVNHSTQQPGGGGRRR